MSNFQKGLDLYKNLSNELKTIEDEPIPEDIKIDSDFKPAAKKTGLSDIKAQAREKVAKDMQEANDVQGLLQNFKKFLSREKRNKMMALCEKDDAGNVGYISMMGFNRVLKSMGFRLMFDQVKLLINTLNVYDERNDKFLYKKIIAAAFRKLYKRDPYKVPPKPTQLEAIAFIKKVFRQKKENRLKKLKITKQTITPKDILNGLAQKIQNSGKALLKTFEEIDKDYSGFIQSAELNLLFQEYGVDLSPDQLISVFKLIDVENVGKINYRSLLKAVESYVPTTTDILDVIAISKEEKEKTIGDIVSSMKILFKDTKMTPEAMFKFFDKEGKGSIDIDTFINVISKISNEYSQFQIKQVFKFIDTSSDGFISYREFGRVFFDVIETPAEILKRKELEEQKRIEEEIKKKWEDEDVKRKNEGNAIPEQKIDKKPTIQEEIKKKQIEAEELQRKEALKKLDPNLARREEQEKKAKELEEKKKKDEDEKKKKIEEEKDAKSKLGRALTGLTTAKPIEEKKVPGKRSSSKTTSSRKTGKKPIPYKKTLEEKASKLLPIPTESALLTRVYSRDLTDMIKKEFIYPLISRSMVHGDSILLARQGQHQYENRAVIKHIYKWAKDWTQDVVNPMPRTIWASGQIGRVGFLDDQSYLNQLDLLNGNTFPVLHLGTKPPFQRTPLLASECDSNLGRLYLLNKQWIVEVWELHQQTTAPRKRIKVLSKVIGEDYVEKYYKNRYRDVHPKLLSLSNTGKIIVNATCVDGFLYCFEPISLTLIWRVRLTLKELRIPEPVMKAFQEFSYFVHECSKLGISEPMVFSLLDRNGDGNLSYEELTKAVKENNLPLSDNQIKAMFRTMDTDLTGNISIDEFWGGINLQNQAVLQREKEEKDLIQLPEWVNNVNANERAKESMYKLHRSIENRGLTPEQLFNSIDTDRSGSLTRGEFSKGLLSLLAPLISQSDIELLLQIADRDNSGSINFKEFTQFLSLKKLGPGSTSTTHSNNLPLASMQYVIYKCIELGIDLYKICKQHDYGNCGTLAKDTMSSVLLSLPIGLCASHLRTITERDFCYSANGQVDYQEIFEREQYLELLKKNKKRGVEMMEPLTQEEAAVVEDFEFIDDLELVAFSTNNPVSSIIYLKHLAGHLVGKLIGHFGDLPPVLHYVASANTLVSGERREFKQAGMIGPELPPCELILWNLQKDLIEKFQNSPPWVVKPFKKVYAHKGSFVDICYLPTTQVLITTATDGLIKMWNPTGRPYSLTEIHNLPIAADKPGTYHPLKPQSTLTNSLLACVGVISNKETQCYRVISSTFDNVEWLICLQLSPSSSKNVSGNIQSWGFKRLNLNIPANQHDWEIPKKIDQDLAEIFQKHRGKALGEYRAGLAGRLEKIVNTSKIAKTFEKEIKIAAIRSIIFEANFDNVLKMIVVMPDRLKKGKVCCEEFYNYLVTYAGFGPISYPEMIKFLEAITEKIGSEPPVKKRSELGIGTLLRLIEEKKNPPLASAVKPKTSVISSIQSNKKQHENMFETPIKGLEEELFEYLSARLMSKKVSVSQLFESIDSDLSGLISLDEFVEFLKKIGYNLKKTEAKSIMKCIDYNNDDSISYKELMIKLKAFGYREQWEPLTYAHTWEDTSIVGFFKNFAKKNQFRNVLDFFQYFDYNKDGSLTPFELRSALNSVDKGSSDRLGNILLVLSKNSFLITDLAKALTRLELELPREKKPAIQYPAMQVCIEKYNSLAALRNCIEDFSLYCLSQKNVSKRGLELLSRQYRISEGLQLLMSGVIRFQELLDYLSASALLRISKETFAGLIQNEYNVQMNTFPIEKANVKKLEADDFKVLWDTGTAISENISEYIGNMLPGLETVTITIYSPSGLKHISRDGTSLLTHLHKELSLHTAFQGKIPDLVKCIGYHEKTIGLDKSVFAVYQKVPGLSIRSLVQNNGGLLKIPLLCNTKVSLYLFKYWGRKLLTTISTIQSSSAALRCLLPENIILSENGLDLSIISLKGLGVTDSAGNINAAPDINLYLDEDVKKNSFIAPEFFFQSSQSTAVDIWSFGAIMYYLLFGHRPISFVEKYKQWNEEKFVKTQVGETSIAPAKSFPYNIFENYEVISGKACSSAGLGVIKALKSASFSGIVRETVPKGEIEEIEEMFKNLKELKNTKTLADNDLGKALDIIALCLQIDPHKRPTVKALMNSSVFAVDKYEEKQAKSFAELIFQHKNPEIVISKHVTAPLNLLKPNANSSHSEEIINIIEHLGDALLNFEDSIGKTTSLAISGMNLSGKEKNLILQKNLNSPITELASQAIKDEVFPILCSLSLNIFSQGDNSVLLSFANLLKYLLFHLNSEDSGLSGLVSVLIEVLLKLFIGEDVCLASKSQSEGYVIKKSLWTPELYEIMGPIYKQSISESGLGHHNCPVIKEYLSKNRHADYFSELLMLAENFNLIRKSDSSTVSKRNALRHIKSMLQTKNQYKTIAALDFKLPQLVIHCVQDSDYKVRAEALDIFLQISEGCIEPLLPKLPGVNKDYRSLGIINFFSIAKKQTHETTKNFEKFSMMKDTVPQAVKDLAVCFENPMFVFPIVRLIRVKSEPYDTKESAVKVLVNALQGNEKAQLACLSPITDTISTLCKCLVVSSRTSDKKSGKSLGPLLKELLGGLLENARSYILAAFKNTPGAEALLKEQGLCVPEKITLPILNNLKPSGHSLDNKIQNLVQALKNWLMHERTTSAANIKEQQVITELLDFLKNSADFFWELADYKPENATSLSPSQMRLGKEKLRTILLFFEWALFNELDLGWFKSENNVQWLIQLTTRGIQSSGSDFEIFKLEEETLICQRILCRVLGKVKDKPNVLLGKLKFGMVYAGHLEIQYVRLMKVISKHTEPLHVLQYYAANSEVRLATFCNLLQFVNLQKQFLDTGFMEALVRDCLTDFSVLNARFNKLSLEFLPFRETPPVRSEAINLIIMILKEKTKCKVVYDDMLLHLQRYKSVQNEIINVMSANPVIQATALELLQAFISSEDKQLEYLLMQGNAKDTFKNSILAQPDIGLRFPIISNYCN